MAGSIDYNKLYAGSVPLEPRSQGGRARYDFAVAYPDPDSLPLDGLWKGLRDALASEGRDLALYPPIQGHEGLRDLIVAKLKRDRGIDTTRDHLALGNGSMQLLTNLIELFVDPGDVVIAEQFLYQGTLRSLNRFRADVAGVPTDEDGMIVEDLEKTLEKLSAQGKKVKLIYTISTFQNPDGSVLSLRRREAVLELAREYGVPILEDECYSDLVFEGEIPPAIRSMDDTGQVLYLGSFSKIVAPGVRLGWAEMPREVLGRLYSIKLDGGPNHLASLAVNEYLRQNMDEHISEINGILREKRDATLSALGEYFPPTCRWSKPRGGLYIWLELPEGADVVRMSEAAFNAGVGYLPGTNFSPTGEGRNCLRLCFGYMSPEENNEGVRLLAQVFQSEGAF